MSGIIPFLSQEFFKAVVPPPQPSPPSPEEEYKNLVERYPGASKMTPELFQSGNEHAPSNRYRNILPNEPTRFKIAKDPKFYFNANWIMGGKAVACQYPLNDEVDRFWQMVWEGKIETIVMLADPEAFCTNPRSKYWDSPATSLFTVQMQSEEVIYQNVEEMLIDLADLIQFYKREILLTNPDGETRSITQFHVKNWPDNGIVSPSVLGEFVKKVNEENRGRPLLAHCNAGIGRTGTFFAVYQALQEQNGDLLKIASELRDPEKGRVGLIQSSKQYALAKKTIELLLPSGN